MHNEHAPERRKYKRIKKHFILTYFDRNDPLSRYSASQLKNISLGGMCLITSKAFEPLAILEIELKTPYLSELVHVEGRVLESNEKIKDIIYETRLEFIFVSDQARLVLDKIIEHFQKEENNDE